MNSDSSLLLKAIAGLGDVGMMLLIIPAIVFAFIAMTLFERFMKFSPTDGMVFVGMSALLNYLICLIVVGFLFFS